MPVLKVYLFYIFVASSGDIVLYYLLVLLVSGGKEDYIEQIIVIIGLLFCTILLQHYILSILTYICHAFIFVQLPGFVVTSQHAFSELKHTVVVHGGHLLFIIEKGRL